MTDQIINKQKDSPHKMRNFQKILILTMFLVLAGAAYSADLTDAQRFGAFPGCYALETGLDGGPTLHLSLVFSVGDHSVNGHAQVTQASASPIVLEAKAHGSFMTLLFMGSPYFVINGKGYLNVHWPPNGGIGPVLLPTLEYHFNTPAAAAGPEPIELDGQGKFRYRSDMLGDWGPWMKAEVRQVECFEPGR